MSSGVLSLKKLTEMNWNYLVFKRRNWVAVIKRQLVCSPGRIKSLVVYHLQKDSGKFDMKVNGT